MVHSSIRSQIRRNINRYNVHIDQVRELENHIHEEYEYLLQQNFNEKEALSKAFQNFGDISTICEEFSRANKNSFFSKLRNRISFIVEPRSFFRMGLAFTFFMALITYELVLSGGNIAFYIEMTSGFIFAFILTSLSFTQALPVLLQKTHHDDPEATQDAKYQRFCLDFTTSISRNAMWIAGALVAYYLAICFSYWTTPEKMGPLILSAIITLLYGLIVKLFVAEICKKAIVIDEISSSNSVEPNGGLRSKIAPTLVLTSYVVIGNSLSPVSLWDLQAATFLFFSVIFCIFIYAPQSLTNFVSSPVKQIGQRIAHLRTEKHLTERLSLGCLLCGLIMSLIELVIVLRSLGDPNVLGMALSVVMLPILYGSIVGLLLSFYGQNHSDENVNEIRVMET